MALTISVITPSYNQGRFIKETIESVLRQNVPVEYVVMDGGSTDNTLDILQSYNGKIRWVSEKDRGQAHAVNKGIQITKGDIIGWLNSDDVYHDGALSKVLTFFRDHKDCDILYGKAWHIDEQGRFLEEYPTEPWDFEHLKEVCFISQPAVFFRRRVVQRWGYLNESLRYCMDYEYWLRLGLSGAKFCYFPEFLASTRLYSDTKTLGNRLAVHIEINDMLRNHFDRVPDRWLFNYAHAWLETKGISRSESPFLFLFLLAFKSMQAAFRWNGAPSHVMLQMLSKWGMSYLRKKQRIR